MVQPDNFSVYESEFHVRYAETDAMGVVHHANYLVYFEEGRSQFMRDRGLDYAGLEEDGFRLPVTAANLRYSGSLRYGQKVIIRTWIAAARSRLLRFAYEVLDPATGKLLVSGSTDHIWTDAAGKVTRSPQQWMEKFPNFSRNCEK